MMHRLLLGLLALLLAAPAAAQELPDGQGEAEYREWLASSPGVRASVLSFEAWQQAAGVANVLPTYQVLRTASMWRECNGPRFEVPPPNFWPDMTKTLKFIRDHVAPAFGGVDAVSGFRNPTLNACARGAARSAHVDFFALDLVPRVPVERIELFRRLCRVHAAHGQASGVGLGFYSFQRFHIDTRSFRRWGSAGPRGDESPCAVIERGEDPLAPPLPVAPPIIATTSPPPPMIRVMPSAPPMVSHTTPPAPATGVAPPEARHPLSGLFHADDYPASALRAREQGTVGYRLRVGPNGRVVDCTVAASSGSSALDATTCRILRSRGRFTPARDSQGNPTEAVVSGRQTWRLPD